ncbi:MAG: hypothetical protein WCR04_03150, partial [Fibrobacteraceae bacterium]
MSISKIRFSSLFGSLLIMGMPLWSSPSPDSIFTEVSNLVRSQFFNANFVRDSLPALEKEFRPQFSKAS